MRRFFLLAHTLNSLLISISKEGYKDEKPRKVSLNETKKHGYWTSCGVFLTPGTRRRLRRCSQESRRWLHSGVKRNRENPNCFELSWGVFFCCLIFDLVQFSFLLFLATSSISIQAWQNPTGSFFRRKKTRTRARDEPLAFEEGFSKHTRTACQSFFH